MSSPENDTTTPEPPTNIIYTIGPVQLSETCEQVSDADEEVFLIYTNLQTSSHHSPPTNPSDLPTSGTETRFRGLGHVDSKKDTLTIKIELKAPFHPIPERNPSDHDHEKLNAASSKSKVKKGRTKHRKDPSKKTPKKSNDRDTTSPDIIEVELWQDKTALRSRKGDTGSVLWKASVDFAQVILHQLYFPTGTDQPPLLNVDTLKNSHFLELGAGTGLLSILLSSFVRKYTVTDIEALIPLIRKNVSINLNNPRSSSTTNKDRNTNTTDDSKSNISIQPLDWLDLHTLPPNLRPKYVSSITSEPADLLLIVDCIYHPSLLPPFLTTIDTLSEVNRTVVLIVVELRAEDVIREFLSLWLAMDAWEIKRVEGVLTVPYVIWVGWKRG